MILGLLVTNLAIAKKIELSFDSNLVVISGETGAGKTIIMNAIGIACGANASQELIRTGEKSALIEASFTLNNTPKAIGILQRLSLYDKEEMLIISRLISKNRTRNTINGHLILSKELKEVGRTLVDLHGQYEAQSLLDVNNHIKLLDKFGGRGISEIREKVVAEISRFNEIKNTLTELEEQDRKYKEERDFINFEISELEGANLIEGEEEELENEEKILSNAKELSDLLKMSQDLINNDEGTSIFKLFSLLRNNIEKATEITEKIKYISDSIEKMQTELKEINRDISNFNMSIIYDPERLIYIEDRLALISKLKMKYKKSIPELIEYLRQLKDKVSSFNSVTDKIDNLKKEEDKLLKMIGFDALKLSLKRKEVAEQFRERVISELRDLAMENVDFKVDFEAVEDNEGVLIDGKKVKLFSDGIDSVQFIIKTNPGDDFKPLTSIASGGEISRVMLAIKTVLAEVDEIPVLAFDEVDAGIGGKTGEKIGEKLLEISKYRQIICITHLPQIASLPGQHFVVEKNINNNETFLTVRELNEYERIGEIARMISGTNVTDTTIKQARELIGRWV
ncbi:MAG: DNA repair protein RecN [Caldiserica bacterium]|nr:DNA repair protein RecN [Caldisericota bacterium]